MKNLVNYLEEFIDDDLCESVFRGNKVGTQDEMIKANRKASREEEIKAHGHPINHKHIWTSKKDYNRKQKHKKNWE